MLRVAFIGCSRVWSRQVERHRNFGCAHLFDTSTVGATRYTLGSSVPALTEDPQTWPSTWTWHLIVDNYATHKTEGMQQAWLQVEASASGTIVGEIAHGLVLLTSGDQSLVDARERSLTQLNAPRKRRTHGIPSPSPASSFDGGPSEE